MIMMIYFVVWSSLLHQVFFSIFLDYIIYTGTIDIMQNMLVFYIITGTCDPYDGHEVREFTYRHVNVHFINIHVHVY